MEKKRNKTFAEVVTGASQEQCKGLSNKTHQQHASVDGKEFCRETW